MLSFRDATSDVREKIRTLLNKEKVKLWLPPYTAENGEKGRCPTELISRYGSELNLSIDVVGATIEELRLHSVNKLAAELRFKQTAVALIKVKLAGHFPGHLTSAASGAPELVIETSLNVQGASLRHQISAACGVAADHLKLVSCGSMLCDELTLVDQHIKHNGHVMALCLSASEAEMLCQEDQQFRVAKAREAAELLSSRKDDSDGYYMQIASQSGQTLDLPPAERKALMLAMVLHEKGRTALKRRQYGEALIFLLEADFEFKKCSASILTSVDNYAMVCLDIVWCYFCLQNITSLPDAEVRLRTCEDCFNRSYGQNLERVVKVKGSTCEERALLLRLLLLQGVLAYIRGQNADAKTLLQRAERELNILKTNESDMIQVMEMGFTELEARLALRACGGDVNKAVIRIMQKREEKQLQRQRDDEERRRIKLVQKFGKTVDGHLVDIEHFDSLVSMGFKKGAAVAALKQSNNDITLAFQILHEHPDLIDLPDPDSSHVDITEEMLAQVTAMGFDVDMARAALHHFGADQLRAIDELVRFDGVVPSEWLQNWQSASCSTSTASTASSAGQQEQREREQVLIDEIIPDIRKDEEDYLDLALDDEAAVLNEYQARLLSLEQTE